MLRTGLNESNYVFKLHNDEICDKAKSADDNKIMIYAIQY